MERSIRARACGHRLTPQAAVCIGALTTDQSNEVGLELDSSDKAPTDQKTGFSVAYVWKSTTFDRSVGQWADWISPPRSPPHPLSDAFGVEAGREWRRMQTALKTFAVDETSVSPYIYHVLLGHDIDIPPIRNPLPARFVAHSLCAS